MPPNTYTSYHNICKSQSCCPIRSTPLHTPIPAHSEIEKIKIAVFESTASRHTMPSRRHKYVDKRRQGVCTRLIWPQRVHHVCVIRVTDVGDGYVGERREGERGRTVWVVARREGDAVEMTDGMMMTTDDRRPWTDARTAHQHTYLQEQTHAYNDAQTVVSRSCICMYIHIPSGCNCQAYIHTLPTYPPMYVILGAGPELVTWLLVSIYTYRWKRATSGRRKQGKEGMVVSVSLATEPQP